MRQAKEAHRRLKHGAHTLPATVHCGCVIHGSAYSWDYVEKLYNMVTRHMPRPIIFHVWTEHDRSVPPHMVKHILDDWPGISGPKQSWWYKLQMFDCRHYEGDLLYFDLDSVIVNDISWTVVGSTEFFWTIRDFRYLQRPTHVGINSSMMWWNTQNFSWVWDRFISDAVESVTRRYPGDQDFLHAVIAPDQVRFFEQDRVQSWRWQCHDGGWDFHTRRPRTPGAGTSVADSASVLIFHGRPKPHQALDDHVVAMHWK